MIDEDDILPDHITLKNVATLIASVTKEDEVGEDFRQISKVKSVLFLFKLSLSLTWNHAKRAKLSSNGFFTPLKYKNRST